MNADDQATSLPPWEHMCDDSLLLTLRYLDVKTTVRLLRATSCKWRDRSYHLTAKYPNLWRTWYDRLGYSPAKLAKAEYRGGHGVFKALQSSCQLTKNLVGCSSKSVTNCFTLPNRCFSFVPVVPDDVSLAGEDGQSDSFYMDDPPPVAFDCDSFILTDQGTEFVVLNPFTLTVSVYDSVLDQAVHSDEGMMEQAWKTAASRIVQQRGGGLTWDDAMSDDDDQEHLLAADAIHETLHRNHYTQHSSYRVAPKQMLVSLSDSVDLRLEDYFGASGRRPAFAMEGDEPDEEYEMSYGGIDAKPIWKNGVWQGTMLGLARIITRLGPNDTEDDCCWEILAWYKGCNDTHYANHRSCRFRGAYNALDVCPHRHCVYLNPCAQLDNDWGEDDNIFSMWTGQRTIRVISLQDEKVPSYQTQPIAQWKCQAPVTAMKVAPFAGEVVVVGTTAQNLEFYTPTSTGATLQQVLSVPNSVAAAMKRHNCSIMDVHPAPVGDIFCAKDLSLEQAGFWTLQHSSVDGSTLVLWKLQNNVDKLIWDLCTVLKLPLSGQRTPEIFYDGRRLLVFGQDHIGMILLIYQVRCSNEEHLVFSKTPTGEQACGGVINVGQSATTRFANRIRHVALGGMENNVFDNLYMTANERFIVLNTKNGNFLSGSASPYCDGLLVIDLEA